MKDQINYVILRTQSVAFPRCTYCLREARSSGYLMAHRSSECPYV